MEPDQGKDERPPTANWAVGLRPGPAVGDLGDPGRRGRPAGGQLAAYQPDLHADRDGARDRGRDVHDLGRRAAEHEEIGKRAVVHVDIKAEELFAIGPLIVTNSMVGALLASRHPAACRPVVHAPLRVRAEPRPEPHRAADRVPGRHRARHRRQALAPVRAAHPGHLPVRPGRELAEPAAGGRHHRASGGGARGSRSSCRSCAPQPPT